MATAVAHSWGGPESAAKRDWLAGSISDLFSENSKDTMEDDIEFRLLDVLETEFEVRLEDESEVEVAKDICRLRKACLKGNFEEVDGLQRLWEERQKKKGGLGSVISQGFGGDDEWEGDVDEEEEGDGGVKVADDDGDLEMDEAPALRPVKDKFKPEVDDDGFTKVPSKKRR